MSPVRLSPIAIKKGVLVELHDGKSTGSFYFCGGGVGWGGIVDC